MKHAMFCRKINSYYLSLLFLGEKGKIISLIVEFEKGKIIKI
jgi:hypothetical protein